ncbi:hypothetical protein ACFCP7_10540 [Paenibacillus elgii]
MLALSLTAGIVAYPIGDSTVQAQTSGGVQQIQRQAEVQPAASNYVHFWNDYLTDDDWWVSTAGKHEFTVNTRTNYVVSNTQKSVDHTPIKEVRFILINKTNSPATRVFEFEGNGTSKKYLTLEPGTYYVNYRNYHSSPVSINVAIYPE